MNSIPKPENRTGWRVLGSAFLFLILIGIFRPSDATASTPGFQAYQFSVQPGTPAYLENFVHVENGCDWLGVAGQVFDDSGQPINRMVVRVEGTLGSKQIDELGLTSLATAYGPGGFEIILNDQTLNSTGTLNIALYNLEGERLTDYAPFNTYADCTKNLILINFQETGSGVITPTVTPIPTGIDLNGSLLLQGRPQAPNAAWSIGLSISLIQPGQTAPVSSFATTTDLYGQYSLSDLPEGTFNISIKGENTLRALLPATTLQSGTNTLPEIILRAGDANSDNFVSAIDFSLLAASFGTCFGAQNYNGITDFNNDQCVSAADFSLLSANYGLQGD